MDAFYEEDERILEHAADPYHRIDIRRSSRHLVEGQTFCPYKGLASYYNVGEARTAAWSYCAPFEEVERITDLVSFYPEKVTITIEGEKLEPVPGQTVISHGPDRMASRTRGRGAVRTCLLTGHSLEAWDKPGVRRLTPIYGRLRTE
jgi:hypothetical protein